MNSTFFAKKLFILLLPLMAVCSSALAQSDNNDNAIRYKGISEEKTYYLYNNKEFPSCNIKINFFYPEAYPDKFILEKIQSSFISEFFGAKYTKYNPKEALKEYVKDYVDEYKEMLEDSGLFLEDRQEAEEKRERIEDYKSIYINEQTIRNTILFNKNNIISQVVNTYIYTGGAHGLSNTTGLVVDLDTGNKVTYEDIFKEDMKDAIAVLILNKLKHNFNVPSVDDLESFGFYFDRIEPSDNFVADDKGITFVYGQYELGAYVLGIIEIAIPYSQLDPYIKEDSPIRRIMNR